MASTTGNGRAFAKVIQNGEDNALDADEVMANLDKVNDMFFVCTEAELAALTPDTKTIYMVSDCPYPNIKLRTYITGDGWCAIPLAKIE